MNTKLLLEVKKQILKEPLQFQMACFFATSLDWDSIVKPKYKIPNCGTAACIAGWTVAIATKTNPKEALRNPECLSISISARKALDLSYWQSELLFNMYRWPEEFKFTEKHTPKQRANKAAKFINWFIKTGGIRPETNKVETSAN